MQIEGGELGGLDDLAHGDLGGGTREHVSAAGAARAANDVGAAQPEHDLLDVVGGKLLARSDVAPGDRPVVHRDARDAAR